MGSLGAILSTGEQALRAQQRAIQVVGQNIANVNTPGYSRERPTFVPAQTAFGADVMRSGVSVSEVTRAYDRFITTQVNVASANLHSSQEQSDLLGQIEAIFNDLGQGEAGLSGALDAFFLGFQELANTPQGMTERSALQQQGETVADSIRQLHHSLEELHGNLNTSLTDDVKEVNRLTSQIAALNGQIQGAEAFPQNHANTLRDERDQLVKQLSEIVGVTSFAASDGQLTVLLGGGRPLVEGGQASTLVARTNPDDPQQLLVHLQDSSGAGTTPVTSSIRSGRLHGLLEVRDVSIPRITTSLNRLAARLTSAVNNVHSNGYGLDGSTGNAFFVPRQATGRALSTNEGGGSVQSVTVADPTRLTLDEYRLTFVSDGPPPAFDVVNTTTGTTLAASQPYSDGTAIAFDGLEVVLSDTGVPPRNGDTFTVSTTHDAARRIAVDAAIMNDAAKIAAAQAPVAGDNANALALAKLGEATQIDGATFGNFYTNLVTSLGVESRQSSSHAEQQQLVMTEIENRREALAGVSLDEEQIDLIRFQQAYAAAASFIKVAQELADTVLEIAR
jgi:flagellar hook-associated protein 1 FlgK